MTYKRGENSNAQTFSRFLIVSHLLCAFYQNKSPGKLRVSMGRGTDTERGIIVTIFALLQGDGRWKGSHVHLGTFFVPGSVSHSLEKLREVSYQPRVLLSERAVQTLPHLDPRFLLDYTPTVSN